MTRTVHYALVIFIVYQKLFGKEIEIMLSEKFELLGKGLYNGTIPDVLTLKSIPTASELDYVGSEDFDKVMIEKILPMAVEEKIDFNNLLEIDYQWLCRCLRILNYGPYNTVNTIFCSNCKTTSHGEYTVNLYTVDCVPLPVGFKNNIVISKDEFIDFDGDVVLHLPTIRDIMTAYADTAFTNGEGEIDRELARICYCIKQLGKSTGMTPFEVKITILEKFSAADYQILKQVMNDVTNYGLRIAGKCQCPKCKTTDATFIVLTDDKFFRPTLGDLRAWKADRANQSAGRDEKPTGSKAENI